MLNDVNNYFKGTDHIVISNIAINNHIVISNIAISNHTVISNTRRFPVLRTIPS